MTTITSTPFSITTAPAGGGAPAFVSNLSDFQVRNLSGQFAPSNGKITLHDVVPAEWQGGAANSQNTSETSIFRAWSGGKGDTAGKRLFVHGGGHVDCANNGLYYYDFNGATNPTGWVLMPNSLSALNQVQDSQVYADHKPSSVHTYDQLWYDPVLGRLYRNGSRWNNGAGTSIAYWDFAAGKWSTDPTNAFWSSPNASSTLGGSFWGKSDGTKLIWIDGDDNNNSVIYTSAGAGTLFGPNFRRNSNGGSICATMLANDTSWLTLSINHDAPITTVVYTHAVNWSGSPTVTSTLRTHASHSIIANASSASGSLLYDSLLNCVWIFALERHVRFGSVSSMSTQILRMSLTDYSITTPGPLFGDSIVVPQDCVGSYNRFVWFPQWRVVGLVHAWNAPMSIFKLPSS